MPTDCISYSETNYFSKLILDYLDKKEDLSPFYNRFPEIGNFEAQIKEKQQSFSNENRKVLVESLQQQFKGFDVSEATLANIEALSKDTTFTITTGHQLNLFTGPLYFLYKIISVINLTKILKKEHPEYDFVPIYWMATEDHDFAEINYFNLNGKKFQWNSTEKGAEIDAVGYLSTEGLDEVFELFSAEIGGGEAADHLKSLFKKAYLEHTNLTEATRYLANELFKQYGLVIMGAQQAELKKLFVPYAENELLEQRSFENTKEKTEKLSNLGYNVQVNPREINLFYLNNGYRERIIKRDGKFYVHEKQIERTKDEILAELHENPQYFSPNVMLRPLYQEVILPNLCYIGGGGELAYWLELKDYFEAENVPFPMLLLRNSALLQSEKQKEKREKLDISNKELFLKQHELINRKVRKISNIDIDFSKQKEHLQKQFEEMYELAEKTDKSFLGAVKAQEVKQLKGLDHLEKRLLKAQKRKLKDEVSRIADLQNQLFPNRSLQERQTNFSEVYAIYGQELLDTLFEQLNPLEQHFKILTFGTK
ncbi:bacillithiol biosynthesis cysteine-adding enzyme BshC [Zunongwangia sp. SCSIO 43204]|uniref:bacillithiol biosynthesis cysteine-adding enzyme BshC n=1 Tax=Zunongwangia sp. SCSIO 43204 TaxID=2779359 RepID=UPI001CA84EFD|nr:bacillithiol biosynthesis cysteine-adding enzyme BshC [Zunongwangia sp. SCSIO 43204]UAB82721.1 bacillithiol biosynthesis cysteine-adding enzyme BshC [Zunongwangia sp. SCSIO 43204]